MTNGTGHRFVTQDHVRETVIYAIMITRFQKILWISKAERMERNCEVCIHKKEKGCELWVCNFKANTYKQGFDDGYFQALRDAIKMLEGKKK